MKSEPILCSVCEEYQHLCHCGGGAGNDCVCVEDASNICDICYRVKSECICEMECAICGYHATACICDSEPLPVRNADDPEGRDEEHLFDDDGSFDAFRESAG